MDTELESIRGQIDRADQLLVARDSEAVGHCGNEVANGADLLDALAALPRRRQRAVGDEDSVEENRISGL